MANTVYKVQSGDNLTKIASKYGTTVAAILKLNPSITNPDYIVVGQEIIVSGTAATPPKKNTSNKANITVFGLQSNTDRTVFATWTWDKNNTDSYRAVWYYNTGDGVWFVGNDSTTDNKQSTYSAPENAKSVKFKVKPISKKYTDTKTKKEVSHWTAEWSTEKKYSFADNPPTTPDGLTARIEDYALIAEIDNIDGNATHIEFQIVRDNESTVKTAKAEIKKKAASYSCDVIAGSKYKVRCRAYRKSDKEYGKWTEFIYASGGVPPETPKRIKEIKALSDTSIQLDWTNVDYATDYEVQWTTQKKFFDSSNEVQSMSIKAADAGHAEITGLASGDEYFFRVRAVNEYGSSNWTDIVSIIIGSKPSAPTTWSSRTTVTTGDKLYLYWVHNTQDGSSETQAELELTINGVTQPSITIDKSQKETEKDRTSVYEVATGSYSIGTKIVWRVRTKGLFDKFSDWSIKRTIDVYAKPTLSVEVLDDSNTVVNPISFFPIYISAQVGPTHAHTPIGYHVTVVADSYSDDNVDEFGNQIVINAGQVIFSRYIDSKNDLKLELSANDIDLSNNANYTVKCVASTKSGLTATGETDFYVSWEETTYVPNADIGIDDDNYTVSIIPYCEDENENLVSNVVLSVYRREFDGKFTEIGTNLPNTRKRTVDDPHPSLDYARYRIIAKDTLTGAVKFHDIEGYPIGAKEVVIQWAEKWNSFDTGILDTIEEPSYGGTLLKLPYNIDVSESNKPDVALVEYIGREQPVSYYGTQLGESATWNVVIPKDDINTIYALRRLAKWMGDVYVREPSGVGYWANITVSFSQKHREMTIPVTFNITRVAGGM